MQRTSLFYTDGWNWQLQILQFITEIRKTYLNRGEENLAFTAELLRWERKMKAHFIRIKISQGIANITEMY
jgi:hypothetical protein